MAYEPEMIALVEAIDANPNAEMGEIFAIKGVRYRIGTYQGEPVIVFATGMSIANAAMSMQMAFISVKKQLMHLKRGPPQLFDPDLCELSTILSWSVVDFRYEEVRPLWPISERQCPVSSSHAFAFCLWKMKRSYQWIFRAPPIPGCRVAY